MERITYPDGTIMIQKAKISTGIPPGGAALKHPIDKKFRIQKKVSDKEFFGDLGIGHTFIFGELRYMKTSQTEGSSHCGVRKFNPMEVVTKTRVV